MSVTAGDKPTVLIDGLVFESRGQIGIWRVFYETISRLRDGFDFVVLLTRDAVQELPEGVAQLRLRRRYGHRRRFRIDQRWRRGQIARRIDRQYPAAIWHSTYFTIDPRVCPRSVVTVHDMIAEEQWYAYRQFENHVEEKRHAVLQASAICTVSHTTKQKLLSYFPALRCPVSVTPLGSDHIATSASPLLVPEPFALYVGDRHGYKNFLILIDAVASPWWPKHMHVKVVGAPFSEAELRMLDFRGVGRQFVHEGRVDDTRLAALYGRSTCCVFPSLKEGFGLPAVESQSLGTVPVVSDIPVFHEVCGDGAHYFNPHCAESLCGAIERVCQVRDRRSLVEVCQKNAERFRWQATADQLADVYRSVMD